jgi:GNAT superfamily N-acetyltransferase
MSIGTPTRTHVRPLTDGDVEAADELAWQALSEVGRRFGFSMQERDTSRIAWAQSRIRHLTSTDPDGCVVAEQDGQVVGVGLAIKRGSLWFLSLLTVRSGYQNAGVGRRMLEATLDYGTGCPRAMICSSPDPKALRSYGRSGFALHAGYEAVGQVDRTAVPANLGVRDGDWERDTEFVEHLIAQRRGEPYGPDLRWCREQGMRLMIRDGGSPHDEAAVLTGDGQVGTLAAASDEAAARVLWAAIASVEGEVTIDYLLNNQQWAIDIALRAHLRLSSVDTLCTRGDLTPPDHYLPSGVFG